MSTTSFVAVFRTDAVYSIEKDPRFGAALAEAYRQFTRSPEPRMPVLITVADSVNNIGGRVLGTDIGEADQVYVIREGIGERVTKIRGSQASLDAIVEVLRCHGYQCRRTSA